MPTVTIAGKQVVFRERLPAKDNWDLLQRIMETTGKAGEGVLDFQAQVPILVRMVESWEFEGDPTNAESYGELDIFREFFPLVTAFVDYLGKLMPGEAG